MIATAEAPAQRSLVDTVAVTPAARHDPVARIVTGLPALGEHTATVLSELGRSPAGVVALRAAGVVRPSEKEPRAHVEPRRAGDRRHRGGLRRP